MKHTISFIVLLGLLVNPISPTSVKGQKAEKEETIVGTVIAQNNILLCIYHPCTLWLIVHASGVDKKQPRYVLVRVEYFPTQNLPDNGLPTELLASTKQWKFKAVRIRGQDKAIEQYPTMINSEQENESVRVALPDWKLLPGAENERIPFGEILPYYLVKSYRYKPHGKRKM